MNNSVRSGISGTKTEQNLRDAIGAESYAYTLYSLYADGARRAGESVLAREFDEIAVNEKEHARLWLEYLGDISGADTPEDILDNLDAAEAGEQYDYEIAYPEYAEIADDEGFGEIADKFRQVAQVERMHRDSMRMYSMQRKTVGGAEPEDTSWKCTNCGYVAHGSAAPNRCPLCSYHSGYYVRMS